MRGEGFTTKELSPLIPCLVTLLISFAEASELPEWAIRGRPETPSERYYVGRSERASSEAAAFREATDDARIQAIRENFGTRLRLQSDSISTSTEAMTTQRLSELSQLVQLRDFRLMDSYVLPAEDGGSFKAFTLYGYSRAAIRNEQARLASGAGEVDPGFSVSDADFSEAGVRGRIDLGVVEVVTNPSNADVFVDHAPVGRSPLRLNSVLSPGVHRLRVEKDGFQAQEQELVVSTRQVRRINLTLYRIEVPLRVDSEFEGSEVHVNEKLVGKTPGVALRIPFGSRVRIRVFHPEAEDWNTEFVMKEEQGRSIRANPVPRPATLTVNTDPKGVEVQLDGATIGTTSKGRTLRKTVQRGNHALVFRKAGFEEVRTEVFLRGGEDHVHPTVNLKRIPPPDPVGTDPWYSRTFASVGLPPMEFPSTTSYDASHDDFDTRTLGMSGGFGMGFGNAMLPNVVVPAIVAALPLEWVLSKHWYTVLHMEATQANHRMSDGSINENLARFSFGPGIQFPFSPGLGAGYFGIDVTAGVGARLVELYRDSYVREGSSESWTNTTAFWRVSATLGARPAGGYDRGGFLRFSIEKHYPIQSGGFPQSDLPMGTVQLGITIGAER